MSTMSVITYNGPHGISGAPTLVAEEPLLLAVCVKCWGESETDVTEKNVNVGVPSFNAQAPHHDGTAFILVNALNTRFAVF
jgi:hypothetical protein